MKLRRPQVSRRLAYLLAWVAIPMGALACGSLLWGHHEDGWAQGVLVEMGITFVGVLITVFYVKQVLQRPEAPRAEWLRSLTFRRLLTARALSG